MESIGHAINSANAIKSFIHSELERSDNKVQDEEQARESKDIREKAMSILRTSISMVDGTLAKLNETESRQNHDADQESFSDLTAPTPSTLKGSVSRSQKIENAKSLVKAIAGQGKDSLGTQSQTVEDMAKVIEPIIKNFDDILTRSYIDKASATLNTVPVVGLKNGQIMYLATKPGAPRPVNEWEFFSKLPAAVPSNAKVHLFPFKGHFYISIGTAVWKKECRVQGDEIIKEAVDNWPKMYKDDWVKIGDDVLRAGNIRSVIPFVKIAGGKIHSHLGLLGQDNKVWILTKDDIYPHNEWSELTCKSGAKQWEKMTYWNDQILSLDKQYRLWNVQVNVDAKTYTVKEESGSQKPLDRTAEFTATELGPVTVRSDGYLYKRFVEDVSGPGNEPALEWTRWVHQHGVTNIGVASPGVFMNLKLLTETMKARYIDTQVALYPMLSKLNTFSKTNRHWINFLEKAARKYEEATTDEKKKIALEQGKMALKHARGWSNILSKASGNSKDAVNIMSRQTVKIRGQLQTQLDKLKEELIGLEATLESEKKQLSVLQAAFWACVGIMFLGILVAIVGLLFPPITAWALAGAGLLFAGGLAGFTATSVLISQLAEQIARTEAQIKSYNESISSMTDIIARFVNLNNTYGVINLFWGRLNENAISIGTNLDAIAAGLEDLLFMDFDIYTAQETNDGLAKAAQLYLDVLHKQGIKLPKTAVLPDGDGVGTFASKNFFPPPQYYDAVFEIQVEKANKALIGNRPDDYERHMEKALESQGLRDLAEVFVGTRAGVWYDIAALSKTASMFEGNHSRLLDLDGILVAGIIFPEETGVLRREYVDIKNKARDVGRAVISMVINIVEMAKEIQRLLQEYVRLKKEGNVSEIKKLKDKKLKKILATCKSAMNHAAVANNSFLGPNRLASNYDLRVQARRNTRQADIDAAAASARYQMQNIKVPWHVILAGMAEAYKAQKRREIMEDYEDKVRLIRLDLKILMSLQSSGHVFRGQSLTWTEMVQKVSGSLGSVHHTLEGVYDMVDVDPSIYEQLLENEWKTVQEQSETVIGILKGQGVSNLTHVSHILELTGGRQEMLVRALRPSVDLGPALQGQSADAKLFFDKMDALLAMPYVDSFIGYWDQDESEKTTLLEFLTGIRDQYVEMMARAYKPVEILYSLAYAQKGGAECVAKGKLSLEKFVKASQGFVVDAQKAAKETADEFKNSAEYYQEALQQIDKNVAEIKKNIKQLDVDVEHASPEERDGIFELVANTITVYLATPTLLAGLGAFGPVTARLALANKLGLGTAATVAGIKSTIASLDLADVAALIARLRSSPTYLDQSREGLEAIKPLFINVVEGIQLIKAVMMEMAELLTNLADDFIALEGLGLSGADAEGIGAAWAAITDDTLHWMDVINAQGIRSC